MLWKGKLHSLMNVLTVNVNIGPCSRTIVNKLVWGKVVEGGGAIVSRMIDSNFQLKADPVLSVELFM